MQTPSTTPSGEWSGTLLSSQTRSSSWTPLIRFQGLFITKWHHGLRGRGRGLGFCDSIMGFSNKMCDDRRRVSKRIQNRVTPSMEDLFVQRSLIKQIGTPPPFQPSCLKSTESFWRAFYAQLCELFATSASWTCILCMCVCVCVCERERERDRGRL